nr:glycosyltransferase family 4 protein [Solimonas terrae]
MVLAKAIPPVVGGIEAYSAELADAYADSGFATTLVTPSMTQRLRPGETVSRSKHPSSTVSQLRAIFSTLRRLCSLRKRKWHFVHATSWRMCLPLMMLGVRARLVVTVHGRELTEQSRLMRWLAQRLLRRVNLLVYVSDATKREIEGALPSLKAVPSLVAWNGVSSAATTAAAAGRSVVADTDRREPLLILSVCRLVKRKNLPFAIRAVGELYRRGVPSFRYVITGNGPEHPALLAAIEELGDAGRCIHLAGAVPEPELWRLYRQADIFFHPQSSAHDARDIEGFGISIIDAMACGLPVVCGRDGGPSEYVIDGRNGFLVDGRDLEQSVDALEKLMMSPELRLTIGQAGEQLVRLRMTWKAHVDAVVEELIVNA